MFVSELLSSLPASRACLAVRWACACWPLVAHVADQGSSSPGGPWSNAGLHSVTELSADHEMSQKGRAGNG